MKIIKATLLAAILMPAMTSATVIEVGAGFAIPDNDASGASSGVTTAGAGLVVDSLSVTLSGLTHTWVGDLIVSITHEASGTSADLMFRTGDAQGDCCGDSSNLGGNYLFADGGADWWAAAAAAGGGDVIASGTYGATTVLGAAVSLDTIFGGLTLDSDWTLLISDLAAGDLGNLMDSWTLTIEETDAPMPTPEPGILMLLGLGLAGLGFARRRA